MVPATANPQPDVLLRVDGVSKIFDQTVKAVDHISLSVDRGEIFALLGSSGCGKSTLLRMLAGFEKPTSGRIHLDGRDITDLAPFERPVNMMFQSYALFPHLNVWDNIAFGLRRDGVKGRELNERVDAMLKLVQLTKFGKRKPHQLSGGQQQRVALARSLAKRPTLLLLDEPLGALDKKLRESTQIELLNIIGQVGVTCVMVTHDQEEAMVMASRIAVMDEGRFLQVGKPDDIYELPNSRKVASFVGSVNLFEGRIEQVEPDHVRVVTSECTHLVGAGLMGAMGMDVAVALRPEKIQLSTDPPQKAHNVCAGEVVDMAYLGPFTTYHIKLSTGRMIKAQVPNPGRGHATVYPAGSRVYASWHRDAPVVLTE